VSQLPAAAVHAAGPLDFAGVAGAGEFLGVPGVAGVAVAGQLLGSVPVLREHAGCAQLHQPI